MHTIIWEFSINSFAVVYDTLFCNIYSMQDNPQKVCEHEISKWVLKMNFSWIVNSLQMPTLLWAYISIVSVWITLEYCLAEPMHQCEQFILCNNPVPLLFWQDGCRTMPALYSQTGRGPILKWIEAEAVARSLTSFSESLPAQNLYCILMVLYIVDYEQGLVDFLERC